MIVTGGSTNVSVPFYFVDDVGGTAPGEPTTGLLYSDIETGGSASYQRQGAARIDFTLITLANASAVHADGGFILINDTEMPGVYRCDIPDAAVADGVDFVIIYLRAAAANNTITRPLKIDLTSVDLRDAVRGGMTALPGAAADGPGGLPISDAGALDMDALNTAAVRITAARAQVLDDWINAGRLDLILDIVAADVVNIDGAAMVGTNNAALASVATEARLAELDAANLPADVDSILLDTGTTLDTKLNDIQGGTFVSGTDSLEAIRDRGDAAWATGSGTGLTSLATGTAQAGGSGSITLAAGESSVDDYYQYARVVITGGQGAGQSRFIYIYNGSNKTAFVRPSWATMPNQTSAYEIQGADSAAGWLGNSVLNSASLDLTATNEIRDAILSDSVPFAGADVAAILVDTNSLNDVKILQALNLTASGNIGIDWANVENPTTVLDLAGTDINLVDTITTYTGNTLQTADHTASIASILTDTAEIGIAGAGLTDVGGMSAGMKAEILAEVNSALDAAISELGIGTPAATPTIRTGLMLLYMTLRNRTDVQTSGADALDVYNAAGTKIASKLLTDAAGDYSEAQMT